jgi:hypothetical protein
MVTDLCPDTSDGQHCFHTDSVQYTPAIMPPEGGFPQAQTCKHCGRKRLRKVEVSYEYGAKSHA